MNKNLEGILKELKEEWEGKTVKLLELDNEMTSEFDYATSIFAINSLTENLVEGFCWEVEDGKGFDFQFEYEENEGIDTIVTVKNIDIV